MAQAPAYDARGFQRIAQLPVAASQTIKKGDFLISSSGKMAQACSAGSRVGAASSGAVTNRIVGRAEADITTGASVTTETVPVMIAEPGTQFALPVIHATAASALPALADIGKAFELERKNDDVDYYGVSLDNTTNKKLKIVEMFLEDFQVYPNAATGDQDGRVWVEFLLNQCCLAGGDFTTTTD